MRAILSTTAAAAAVLLLAGCTSAPPRAEVVERFAIELEGASDGLLAQDDPRTLELAEQLTDDALSGGCGTSWTGYAESPDLLYAWAMTCEMYFSGEMSDAQRDQAKQMLLERVADEVG